MAESETSASSQDVLDLTSGVVAAYVSHNNCSVSDLHRLIVDVHAALTALATGGTKAEAEPAALVPAVSIRKSLTPEYLICLDDGKKFKSLKRHLTQLGMTPDEYRTKWGLPKDYPMVAPNYAATRSALALSIGLGRKKAVPVVPTPVAKPARKRSMDKAPAQ